MSKRETKRNLDSTEPIIDKEIGIRIKDVLKKKQITQVDFANNYLHHDHVTFNKKINGVRSFSIPDLKDISKLLDVDLMYILCETDDPDYAKNLYEKVDVEFERKDDDFFSQNKDAINFLKSIGYDVDLMGYSGSASSDNIFIDINIVVHKNEKIVKGFNIENWNKFITKLNLLVELILID